MSTVPTVVYKAATWLTMDGDQPEAQAVAVRDGRILAVGTLDEVTAALAGQPFVIDDRLAEHVVLPGLIDQHLHPILGATTLMTEIISTEQWDLPDRTFPAAGTPEQFRSRLAAAHQGLADRDEWLFSWGYHQLWHGPLDRTVLDSISADRPIGVWQRSCHEFYLNSAAIERLDITEADSRGRGAAAEQVDLAAGHWWENGFFTILMQKLGPVFLTPTRLTAGLHQLVAYLHQHGVTAFNEPGIAWDQEPFALYQQILGADDTPMLSTFLVDARVQAESGMDPADAVADAQRQIARAPSGKVSLVDQQVKLFADGAIISQLMQMKDGYLDADGQPDPHHHGEWLMSPEALETFATEYWKAGWQIHTHVNGDLGLEVLLGVLERCQAAHPRIDHRSVIVHFANSTEEQVDRIARLGAIVSANPYYVSGFADKYAIHGLGPARADAMVRTASVLGRGIPLSFHSDLPMGPADPLRLAGCAINRITQSGRIAGPEQRIPVHAALRAITIEAAYSWRREHDLGSITPGKLATFTVLAANPYDVEPTEIEHIPVVGTMFEGRWFPVPAGRNSVVARADRPTVDAEPVDAKPVVPAPNAATDHGATCGCAAARHLAAAARRAAIETIAD
jgi:predicted amidohydrolase YtcJ